MRRLLVPLFRLVLKIFFRRIQVTGLEQLPATGPTIVVLNHPSALIDPLFVICLIPRRAAFLAKEPLFRMPVIGALVRSFDSIPVHRLKDVADMSKNRETFEKARALLASGGVLALFPEGVSHNDPHLRPLKTGAARIALGAAAAGSDGPSVRMVPAGLNFTDKGTFRSEALMALGAPVTVPTTALEPNGEPPAGEVRALTARIEQALSAVTVQADHQEALNLATRAERLFGNDADSLSERVALRRRIIEGRRVLVEKAPVAVARLEDRLARLEASAAAAEISPELLSPESVAKLRPHRVGVQLVAVLLLAPLALIGTVVHWPPYRLIGVLARNYAKDDAADLATAKVLGGLLFMPLTWALMGVLAARWGWAATLGALAETMLSGWAAIVFWERLERLGGFWRLAGLATFRRQTFRALCAERAALRSEIFELSRRWLEPGAVASDMN